MSKTIYRSLVDKVLAYVDKKMVADTDNGVAYVDGIENDYIIECLNEVVGGLSLKDLIDTLLYIDDTWFNETLDLSTLREAMEETVSLSLLDYLTELYDV